MWKTKSNLKKYLFSSNGDIKNIKNEPKFIHKNLDVKTENRIKLSDDTNKRTQYNITKLIAELFLDNSNYNHIRHKDGNINNNNVNNLEYYDRKTETIEKYLQQIPIIDPENRWDYSLIPSKNITSQTDVPLKCNGCNTITNRSLYEHVTQFKHCKRNCYKIKSKDYQLNNLEIKETTNDIIIDSPEEWKIFPDNNNYEVSNKGFIRNIKTKKSFGGCFDKHSGYMRTNLNNKYISIHYAVGKTYIPNPENLSCINHKNKDRTDNRVENLEWCTYAENNKHKVENSVKQYKKHGNSKRILRLDKDTNVVLDTYSTLMCACKWIMEEIFNISTNEKDVDKQLKSNSSTLSNQMKRDGEWFGYGFKWKFETPLTEKEGEEWKLITSMEKEGYYISSLGRLKTPLNVIKDNFSITSNFTSDGYYDIKIVKGGKHHRINRLVAIAFVPNPENKPYVNHINHNTLDNRAENLEWVTNQENIQHAYDNDLVGGVSPVIQFDKTGETKIAEFKTIQEASRQLNINQSQISAVCRGVYLQTKGFHFKYKENENEKIREKKTNLTNSKKVYQYDTNNNLINTYDSVITYANQFKVKVGKIQTRLKGSLSKDLNLNNFQFSYTEIL